MLLFFYCFDIDGHPTAHVVHMKLIKVELISILALIVVDYNNNYNKNNNSRIYKWQRYIKRRGEKVADNHHPSDSALRVLAPPELFSSFWHDKLSEKHSHPQQHIFYFSTSLLLCVHCIQIQKLGKFYIHWIFHGKFHTHTKKR